MSIKLIVMDLDGTLLGEDHATVPARNVTALRSAADRGVKLAVASGRTWSLLVGAQRQLGRLDYAIMSNGAAVRDVAAGKSVYEDAMPNEQALVITQVLHREGLIFEIYCGGQNYVRASDREAVLARGLSPAFTAFFDAQTVYCPTIKEALAGRGAEKFDLFYVPDENRTDLTAEMESLGPVAVTQALRFNMEFNAPGVNKGKALEGLCKQLGLAPEEVMAFGDADNDLEMLRWAGWSFAMENAAAEVKAAARYVTGSNVDAGVGQAVEKYVLGQ